MASFTMLAATAWDVFLLGVTTFGVGAACAPRLRTSPLLRLAAGVAAAIGCLFAVGFAGFCLGLPNPARAAAAFAVGIVIVIVRRRAAIELGCDPTVRRFLLRWLILVAWALGLLALVVTYSGGGWAADWVEHWQRTQFFLGSEPLTTRFALVYPLTARPPLANLIVALWLGASGHSFAHFQVLMTVFGSLVLLPAEVVAERWQPNRSTGWWVLIVVMLSPVVAQNLTFAWTKLPTAFFVLTGITLGLAAIEDGGAGGLAAAAVGCLALGGLTHYSAIPWCVAFAAAYLCARRSAWGDSGFWRRNAGLLMVYIGVFAPWVAWAVAHFGWRGTIEMNTTAGAWLAEGAGERLWVPLRNLFDTLVPFPWRGTPSDGLLNQASRLGLARDIAFNLYQINLPLGFGLGGFWVLAANLVRPKGRASSAPAVDRRDFWWALIPTIIVLGIAVHTPRDEWGLAHICLQPLVLLGLARVAASLTTARPVILTGWVGLTVIDVTLGLVLQFGLESWSFSRFVAPGHAFIAALSRAAVANANDKAAFQLEYFADRCQVSPVVAALWLALCAAIAIVGLRRVRASASRL